MVWTDGAWGQTFCKAGVTVAAKRIWRTTVFKLKERTLHHLYFFGMSQSDLWMKRRHNMLAAKCAAVFCWHGLQDGEMLGIVDNMGVRDVVSAHFKFTNMVSSVPKATDDVFARRWFDGKWSDGAVDLTNAGALMMGLGQMFSNLEELVLHVIARRSFTAKTCPLLDRHGPFIGCERDGGCLKNSSAGIGEP